jgi:hypothetical protein
MPELAQTNVQLLRQVVERGWTDEDLVRLRSAYELAMWVFSGQYRANGKTQIAHHVGVASALAAAGERPVLVTGGLVHSVYFLGEFGGGRRGPHADKRARVAATVGGEIDEMVDAYTATAWDGAAVRTLIADVDRQPAVTRDVVAMRLANEVDEYTDATMRLSADHHTADLDGEEGLALLVRVAGAYGLEPLGDALRVAMADGAAMQVPPVLVSPEDNTVFVPPASYRRRLHVVLQDSRLGHEVAVRVPGARELAARVRRKLS